MWSASASESSGVTGPTRAADRAEIVEQLRALARQCLHHVANLLHAASIVGSFVRPPVGGGEAATDLEDPRTELLRRKQRIEQRTDSRIAQEASAGNRASRIK